MTTLTPPQRGRPCGLRLCALLTAIGLLALACGTGGSDSGAGNEAGTDAMARIDAALGHVELIDTYRFTAEGERHEPGQGASIGDIVDVSTFDVEVTTDLASGNLRLDWTRTMGHQTVVPGSVLAYAETVNDDAGYIDGGDGVFGIGPSRPMNGSRLAAVRRQQQLLQPHLLVAETVRRGDAIIMIDDTIELTDPSGLVVLLGFDEFSGDLSTVATIESDPLLGDIEVEARFSEWTQLEGIRFPMDVELAVDGVVVHHERRSNVDPDPLPEPERFDLAERVQVDAASYEQGWTNSQWFNRALALPFGSGFVDQTLDAPVEVVRISPNVALVAGTRHNSVLVDVGESVVVVEPSINADRSRQLIDVAAEQFSGKPISHVVLTHDHHDQIGGVREAIAGGATAVLPAGDEAFFKSIFSRTRTIEPDGLSRSESGTDVAIETVDEAGWSAGNGAVTAHRFSSIHDEHMLLVCLPNEGLAFNSDLFNPGFGEPDAALPEPQRTFAAEVVEAIKTRCPTTTGVLGSHGMPAPAPLEVVVANAGSTTGDNR